MRALCASSHCPEARSRQRDRPRLPREAERYTDPSLFAPLRPWEPPLTAPPPTPPQQTPETWMAALSRVMARVTAAAEEDAATDALLAGLVDEFGAAFGRIWLIDPTDNALHLHASAGAVEDPEAHSE